jgi:hypothetical protein
MDEWADHPISPRCVWGDDLEMRQNPAVARGLISRCFDAADMAYLQQQVEFQSAIAVMGTLDEFESTAGIGDHLLFKRDEIRWSTSFKPAQRIRELTLASSVGVTLRV